MHGNKLIVIENGQLISYTLDDKLVWDVGRPSKDNMPDIRLHSATVSRRHGRFQNVDGVWFYYDKNGKNGTVYNGMRMKPGIRGRVRPVALKDKDVLIFGGGEAAVINSRTIWALFTEKTFDDRWRVEDTKAMTKFTVSDGAQTCSFEKPEKGTVIELDGGMAIYMGDVTYLTGAASVCTRP
jgi:pSer/pThr/pTyr-binding forkhead associated (FHA) protein